MQAMIRDGGDAEAPHPGRHGPAGALFSPCGISSRRVLPGRTLVTVRAVQNSSLIPLNDAARIFSQSHETSLNQFLHGLIRCDMFRFRLMLNAAFMQAYCCPHFD